MLVQRPSRCSPPSLGNESIHTYDDMVAKPLDHLALFTSAIHPMNSRSDTFTVSLSYRATLTHFFIRKLWIGKVPTHNLKSLCLDKSQLLSVHLEEQTELFTVERRWCTYTPLPPPHCFYIKTGTISILLAAQFTDLVHKSLLRPATKFTLALENRTKIDHLPISENYSPPALHWRGNIGTSVSCRRALVSLH